jgi:hypothetical protein
LGYILADGQLVFIPAIFGGCIEVVINDVVGVCSCGIHCETDTTGHVSSEPDLIVQH